MWANGLFDESDAAYREAIALAPESSRAHFGLARSMATRSQLEEALKEALPVAAAAPQDPEIHALIGLIYERLNRYEESADAYERYIALLPMTEISTMATISQSKVRLLRSFKGRVPLQVDDAPGRVHRVPFRLSNRKIVLQGRVNRVPVEFVLDTGSERTGLSDVTARRAGVASITATLTAGVGVAALRRLELGRADSIEVGNDARAQRSRRDQDRRPRRAAAVAERKLLAALDRLLGGRRLSETGSAAGADAAGRAGGLQAADADESSADGSGAPQFHASGVLRRRHGRRADLNQRRDGAVAGDAAGAQDSACASTGCLAWTRTPSCCRG